MAAFEDMRKAPITSLMRAQIISSSEKSEITSFTLMRDFKSADCDHFRED